MKGNKYIDTSNPFGKAAVAATKTFGPALIEDVMRKYIEDPDSFNQNLLRIITKQQTKTTIINLW